MNRMKVGIVGSMIFAGISQVAMAAAPSATKFHDKLAAVPGEKIQQLVYLLNDNGKATPEVLDARTLTFIQFLNANFSDFNSDPGKFIDRVLANRGLIVAADHKKITIKVIQTGPSCQSECACRLFLDFNCTPGLPIPRFGGVSGCEFQGCLVMPFVNNFCSPTGTNAQDCVKDALCRYQACMCNQCGVGCPNGPCAPSVSFCNACG